MGRLPFAMMIVGMLTLISTARGSIAEAGLAAALAGLGTAALGPLAGSLADRYGQRVVLLVMSGMSILAVAVELALVATDASTLAVVALAFGVGATMPQVAPFSRSRLAQFAATARSPRRRARAISLVMSYESVMDETSFVIGPVLVGLLTTLIAPWAPLVIGVVITATIVVAFAVHPSARVVTHAAAHDRGGRLPRRVLLLALAMLAVGGMFGSILTALTGYMSERNAGEQTGIIYGAMSVGAIAIAIAVAALPARVTLGRRWLFFAVLALAGALALALAAPLGAVLAGLLLAGAEVGAVLVTLFSLGNRTAPAGRSTMVMTTLQSSLVVGQALATAVCGVLVEQSGPGAGYAVTVGLAVVLIALAVVDALTERRRAGARRVATA
ncbi:MFS transporter [Salinibacterium sp. G-O1]|uniref:MFS transporter n=1 Tax=Salinibacterium sp. G-O1 TaxID=3046208 RepID=UPI0024B9A453|nr:MFS transporter [Salinibacterium sp. G-O1]MDJ0334090.1 MFS transporter [Salinibacterium sp. G-O1]